MHPLAHQVADAPFVWVVGKGGVGKTTAAAALALHVAEHASPVHLISTDPAHSLSDVLDESVSGDVSTSRCSRDLTLEAFDAPRRASDWLAHAMGGVASIIEAGTYLDAEDVTAFSSLALPGVDEMMAVLRLVELADSGRTTVVDTAPTGHALRLLDAGETHAGFARALRAMADKAAAVAGSFAGRAVRIRGEEIVDELERTVQRWNDAVLGRSRFIIVTAPGEVVQAETARLASALSVRRLQTAATLLNRANDKAPDAGDRDTWVAREGEPPIGCAALRRWLGAVVDGTSYVRDTQARRPPQARSVVASADGNASPPDAGAAPDDGRTPDLLATAPERRLVTFAGKGGVGKSTCAAAFAVHAAQTRDVLLCSVDPAGSLDELLPPSSQRPARLRTLQVQPETAFAAMRESWREQVDAALDGLGIAAGAALDRRVLDSVWDLTPPGLDELAAAAAIIDSAAPDELVVLDTAPTGHFLRLLSTPAVALDWTRQFMRVVVKYGLSGTGDIAESLLRLARELKSLDALFGDAQRAGIVVVTLPEAPVAAETARLIESLRADALPVIALLVNRSGEPRGVYASTRNVPVVAAPECALPPRGTAELSQFVRAWRQLDR